MPRLDLDLSLSGHSVLGCIYPMSVVILSPSNELLVSSDPVILLHPCLLIKDSTQYCTDILPKELKRTWLEGTNLLLSPTESLYSCLQWENMRESNWCGCPSKLSITLLNSYYHFIAMAGHYGKYPKGSWKYGSRLWKKSI